MSSTTADDPVIRVRPEAVRMARALVRSAARRGALVDPVVAKIAKAEPYAGATSS
ncbi:hypothetical protein [Luteipulveratus mongoliensis]|uniref:hypothetical protein n=1 Tax=Luteipulveratus mongoliensis TaxID=571913 RepID=UPI0012EE90D3|nr:hypothetical protein [Luteipulveratus mongoliensis]